MPSDNKPLPESTKSTKISDSVWCHKALMCQQICDISIITDQFDTNLFLTDDIWQGLSSSTNTMILNDTSVTLAGNVHFTFDLVYPAELQQRSHDGKSPLNPFCIIDPLCRESNYRYSCRDAYFIITGDKVGIITTLVIQCLYRKITSQLGFSAQMVSNMNSRDLFCCLRNL